MRRWIRLLSGAVVILGLLPTATQAGDDGQGKAGKRRQSQLAGAPSADKPGQGHDEFQAGLVAHYFTDPEYWAGNWPDSVGTPTVAATNWTFTNYASTRVEPLLNNWFIRHGWFTVRWQGYLDTLPGHAKPDEPATYKFHLWADDGCRLLLDGKVVVDSWQPTWHAAPESHRYAEVELTPGRHRIVVEYFQGQSLPKQDRDPLKLYWECAARQLPEQIIPASHFTHTAADLIPPRGRKD